MSLTLATVTGTSPVTVKVDGDSVDQPVIALSGQSPSVSDRVLVWTRGSGRRPFLLTSSGSGGGGSSGVSSFNTRTGAVTLSKADVTGTGLAAADVGAAPAISALAGSLSSDVTGIGTSAATVLTTSTLAVGTWLVEAGVSFVTSAVASAACSLSVASGTATISGQHSTAAYVNSNHNGAASVRAVVVVTAAATVAVVAVTDTSTVTAKAANPVTSAAGASGWTAVKVG